MADRSSHPTNPPEAWLPARRLALALLRPVERFLHIEAASGFILLAAAAVALVWANSPWHLSYEHLWETAVTIGVGSWSTTRPLHFWINEGLMTVFFLVVGLEIKREIVEGALSNMRRAALPIAAAMGGMGVPALVYFAFNPAGATSTGWGVPMATDIAFAVGVLTLLGPRVPAPMRVLLLALAIIDDIGAILVIALFYSTGFAAMGLAMVAAGVVLLVILKQIGVRPGWGLAPPLVVIWTGLLQAGVHPTIAGVIVGLSTPARSWIGREGFLTLARNALDRFQAQVARGADEHALIAPLHQMAFARREALSPALRVETALHGWVAFGIMPLFALANAGVTLHGMAIGGEGFWPVLLGVTAGLVVGKPLGILLASWLVVRLGIAALPPGVGWREVGVVGLVAGIGFTMAIFIAELAFVDQGLLGVAKLGILIATAVAAVAALLAGRALLSRQHGGGLDTLSDSDAESSTAVWGCPPAPPAD